MTCITDYNLLKEGDIYNVSDSATYLVTSSGFSCLYDGDLSSTAYSIPAGAQSSVEVKFGEYIDICNAKYYASSLVLGDMWVGYGQESADENTAVIVSSGTFAYLDIGQPIGCLRITHSGTSTVNVRQLYIEGVLNDDIGVGTSSSGEVSDYFLDNSPIKHYSSSYMTVPVFNEYPHDVDIKVAVEAVDGLEDNYLHLSADSSGPYFGMNDYGKRIPAFVQLRTSSDSLTYTSLSTLKSNWDVHITSETFLSLGSDYVQLNVTNNNNYNYRTIYGSNDMRAASFVAKDFFTGDQSFTVSIKVRYYNADFDEDGFATENKVLVGFTDTFPIVENNNVLIDSRDYPYHNRTTNSLAASWFGGVGDRDLRVGGAANSSDYNNLTDFNSYKQTSGIYRVSPLLSSIKMEDLSAGAYGEAEYEDDTTESTWRELKLSYDHTVKKCYYFVDDIQLDTFQFFSSSFFENCKLFFSFIGDGPAVVQFKDFVVSPDEVLVVNTNQSSATAIASIDPTDQGPDKLINKKFDTDNILDYAGEEAWVSGNDPQVGDYFTINFDTPEDLDAVRIKQVSSIKYVTVSGSTQVANLALNRAIIDFDTGDTRIVNFQEPTPTGLDGWDVSYLLTTSGTIEPVLGVSSATVKYSTFHDREASSSLEVFGVDEIEFYNLDYIERTPDREEEVDAYTWSNGHFVNLKSKDSSTVYHVNETDKYDVAAQQDKWKLFRYADYDAKNLIGDSTGTLGGPVYHYGESLFAHSRWAGSERREMQLKSGPSAWAWRYFPNKVNIAAFYSYIVYYTETIGFFHSRVDKWKVQYLSDGGNPNSAADWVDIPPLTIAHTSDGYDDYSQYLVDNNDGEYYTNFADLHSTVSTFVTTEDLYCNKNAYNKITSIYNRSGLYVEFPETYLTQGIKLVIDDGFDTLSYPSDAEGYSITSFLAYSDEATGFYVSPVFDMDTPQNTERIWTNVEDFDGSSRVLYRSSSVPPNYSLEPFYESWQDFGAPFSGLDTAPDFGYYFDSAPVVSSDGEYIYVFPVHPSPQCGFVYRINLDSNEWEEFAAIDSEVDGEVIAVDPRTKNPVIYIGGAFIVATRSGDNPYTNGLSILHLDETAYAYSGWENFPYQRQTSAVYSVMVYDGSDRVFFIGEDLDVTVFYKSTGELTTEARAAVPGHGYSTRQYMSAAYVDGKIYVAGGNSSSYLDIYDVAADSWESGTSAPNTMLHEQMIHVDGWLYVLPTAGSHRWAPCMKYDIANDVWYDIPSMNYNTSTFILDSQYGTPDTMSPTPDSYCLHGDYIYALERYRSDFRRVKVVPGDWSSGNLPSYDVEDSTWFNNGGMSWKGVTVSGELMPQDRYIQYKVDLSCTLSGTPPVISSSSLVQPITLSGVTAGGSSDLYVKTNISDEVDYDLWYTGRFHNYGAVYFDSILYTKSKTGLDFYGSTVVERSSRYDLGDGPFCFRDPCVMSDVSGYTMWAVEAEAASSGGDGFELGEIYRATSVDKYNFGSFSLCMSKGTEGTYDTNSIYGPCVLKDSQYKMWYTGEDVNGIPRILYAVSTDGITWTGHQLSHDVYTPALTDNPDRYGARNPSVVVKDSLYWLYYEGVAEDGNSSIILCKSSDGLNWTNHEVVMTRDDIEILHDCNGCGSPCVVDDDDEMLMWFVAYTTYDETLLNSVSVGGSTWSNFSPVVHRGEYGYEDAAGVSSPFVMLDRRVPDSNTFMNARIKIYND